MRYLRWIVLVGLSLSACSPAANPVVETTPVASTTRPTSTTASTDSGSTTTPVAGGPNSSIADIEPIRTITPDEWGYVIGQCLIDRGLDVNIVAADHLNY